MKESPKVFARLSKLVLTVALLLALVAPAEAADLTERVLQPGLQLGAAGTTLVVPAKAEPRRRSPDRTWTGVVLAALGAAATVYGVKCKPEVCLGRIHHGFVIAGTAMLVPGVLLATVWSDVPDTRR